METKIHYHMYMHIDIFIKKKRTNCSTAAPAFQNIETGKNGLTIIRLKHHKLTHSLMTYPLVPLDLLAWSYPLVLVWQKNAAKMSWNSHQKSCQLQPTLTLVYYNLFFQYMLCVYSQMEGLIRATQQEYWQGTLYTGVHAQDRGGSFYCQCLWKCPILGTFNARLLQSLALKRQFASGVVTPGWWLQIPHKPHRILAAMLSVWIVW